jgi:hypothetical protein
MLDALGNLGDFIGGIAVVITLIYLAVQVRQNTRAIRVATMQSSMLAAQSIGNLPAQDRDLARVVRVGLTTPDELDEDEFQQLRYFLMSMLRVHEDMFVQHQAGVVDDETWLARSSSLKTIFSMPGGRRIWEAASAYRDDFKAWLESELNHEPLSNRQHR